MKQKRLDGEKEDNVSVSLWLIVQLLSGSVALRQSEKLLRSPTPPE